MAPKLIGLDPRELGVVNRRMDEALRGHAYVKSPIDVACWDILGKDAGLPIVTLLGGSQMDDIKLYRAISQEAPQKMSAKVEAYWREGYRKFQLKAGGRADDDIARIKACRAVLEQGDVLIADSNTGWTMHEAVRVANAVRDVDVYIEQPCRSYDECLSVRRNTTLPFVLDEIIDGIETLMRAIGDHAMDVINLKISKVGGLTKAKQMRDLCVSAGVSMTIEDTWGGDFATAAIAHLAQSTPEEFLFSSTDFNSYGTKDIARGAPVRVNGTMRASNEPGLGCEPIMAALGKPVMVVT